MVYSKRRYLDNRTSLFMMVCSMHANHDAGVVIWFFVIINCIWLLCNLDYVSQRFQISKYPNNLTYYNLFQNVTFRLHYGKLAFLLEKFGIIVHIISICMLFLQNFWCHLFNLMAEVYMVLVTVLHLSSM